MGACGASTQQKVLHYTTTALNTSMAGLTEWSKREQERIFVSCTGVGNEGAQKCLEKVRVFRDKRDKVVQFFIIAYSSVALYALDPSPASLAAASGDLKLAYDAVKILMGGK
jgi:hypothetical protein